MKTIEELKTFYEQNLRTDLKAIERRRWAILRGFTVALFILLPLVLIFGAFLLLQGMGAGLLILPVILTGLILGVITFFLFRGYRTIFKERIIRPLVSFLNPELNYSPFQKIPKETFNYSRLFKTRPNRYKGDDLVRGRIGKTRIEFSEVLAQYVQSNGKTTTVHTVFQGLFFIADFNKHFRTRTYVLPDSAEKMFGSFGKMLQKWNLGRPPLVHLEDPEFEREFAVYGDDPIETRYILSLSLMERILQYKRKTRRSIHLAFLDSKVFMAISCSHPLFEPKVFSSMLDFSVICEYFEDLQIAVGIVDDLNLNTRIWSKE